MEKKPAEKKLRDVPRMDELQEQVERQSRRMRDAEEKRAGLFSQTVYIGTLGLLFVLPLVGGAYLGHWLDSLVEGYSIRWTMSLIFIGLVCGAFNVYLFIRE
jgi:ATP synthase protein I